MFGQLFARQTRRPAAPPDVGDRLVYAVGDIHGRLDLLKGLVQRVCADAISLRPDKQPMMIFLGDYIDRGSDSRGVLEHLRALQASVAFEVRLLKGNHEEELLRFLDDAAVGPIWAEFGGRETLQSYGITAPRRHAEAEAWESARAALNAAMPAAHRRLLEALEVSIAVGDYFFVHAGVRPGVALEAQSDHDLMWIREEFLYCDKPFGKVVVHGHTPLPEAELKANRISIDTGAYATGLLTSVRLDGEQQHLIQFSG